LEKAGYSVPKLKVVLLLDRRFFYLEQEGQKPEESDGPALIPRRTGRPELDETKFSSVRCRGGECDFFVTSDLNSAVLIFPKSDEETPWLDDDFVISHEIAHATQHKFELNAPWKEARADLISYFRTGKALTALAPRNISYDFKWTAST